MGMTPTFTVILYILQGQKFLQRFYPCCISNSAFLAHSHVYSSVKIRRCGQHDISKHLKPIRESGRRWLPKVIYLLLKPFRGIHCCRIILYSPARFLVDHSSLLCRLTSHHLLLARSFFQFGEQTKPLSISETSYLVFPPLKCSYPLYPQLTVTPAQTWHLTSPMPPSRRSAQNPQRKKKEYRVYYV